MNYANFVVAVVLTFFSAGVVFSQELPVTKECLGCICEAISECNTTNICTGDVCGPFRITWAYWADAGKPTPTGVSVDDPQAYARCAGDIYCAALSVQGYMNKFQQDCNGDNKIDCDDYATIHSAGGYGCRGAQLPIHYSSRYQQCKTIVGNLRP